MSTRRSGTPSNEADVSCCRYTILHDTVKKHGMLPTSNGLMRKTAADRRRLKLVWADHSLDTVTLQKLTADGTVFNQFPGIAELTRKCPMHKLLRKMERLFPGEYRFVPKSFASFEEYKQSTSGNLDNKLFICKPSQGCMGRDVVIRYGRDIDAASFSGTRLVDLDRAPLRSSVAAGKVYVKEEILVQEYIDRPLLLHNKKCDLRCYVLVRSMQPLEVHFYREGMVRCCVTEYSQPTEDNLHVRTMHLANYAVNKDVMEGDGSDLKYSLQYFSDAAYKHALPKVLEACKSGTTIFGVDCAGRQSFEAATLAVEVMWSKIHHLVVKTVAAATPAVTKALPYAPSIAAGTKRAPCFHVLGFDLMIDEELEPWLIEVNHSPSWHTDTEFDYQLKRRVLRDTMRIVFPQKAANSPPEVGLQHDDDDEVVEGNGYIMIYPSATPSSTLKEIVDHVAMERRPSSRAGF